MTATLHAVALSIRKSYETAVATRVILACNANDKIIKTKLHKTAAYGVVSVVVSCFEIMALLP